MNKLLHVESFTICDGDYLSIWFLDDVYIVLDDTEYEPKYTNSVLEIFNLYISKKNLNMETDIINSLSWNEDYVKNYTKDLETYLLRESSYRCSKYYNGKEYEAWPDYIKNFHKEWNSLVWEEVLRVKNKLGL